MDDNIENVAALLNSVLRYSSQLADSFSNYALIVKKMPVGMIDNLLSLNSTTATVKQLLTLIDPHFKEAALFTPEAEQYITILAKECATTLAKIQQAIEGACLEHKERKALQRRRQKAAKKVDAGTLVLDEKEFMEKLEGTNWGVAQDDLDVPSERLIDIQLHLLLVFQVGTVGTLGRKL